MSLMSKPGVRIFLCWFDDSETIEDAWQCEAANPREAAEAYWSFVGIQGDAVVRVGSAQFSETWRVDSGGEAHSA